jgi:SAM-dependent methyltransferase
MERLPDQPSPAPLFRGLAGWDPAPLRRALEAGGYTQATLQELELAGTPYQGRAAAVFRESLPQHGALRALARLFLLGDAVPAAELPGALGLELGPLAELGLLRPEGGSVRAAVSVVPYGGGWHASDFLRVHGAAPADYVMGLSPVTRMLAALVPRSHGRSALELGCGGGWLSLQLRRGGLRVTGTDISPRALELARFNQRLNGIGEVEWLEGSWFEPLGDRRFDLIACNPPYVQSPGGPLTFRETRPGGEDPCVHLLQRVHRHLEPGGFGCLLLNWCQRAADESPAPLDWAPAAGLRRWLFQAESLSPAAYAWRWIKPDPRFEDEAAARAEMERWIAHHRAAGTRAVASGFLVVQRCEPGAEWTRCESRTLGELPADSGAEVLRVFGNETWLRGAPDDPALLEGRYLVPDGIRAHIGTALGDRGWQDRTIRLTSPATLSYDGQVDENLLRLLELCRAGRRPAEMVAELRAQPQFAQFEGLEARIAALTRELVRHALLAPL